MATLPFAVLRERFVCQVTGPVFPVKWGVEFPITQGSEGSLPAENTRKRSPPTPGFSSEIDDILRLRYRRSPCRCVEEFSGLSSRKGKGRAQNTSLPRLRSQTFDPSGWEEYWLPIADMRLHVFPSDADSLVWGLVLNSPPRAPETALPSSTPTQRYAKGTGDNHRQRGC
jgi:hypothetical protein